MSVSGLRKRTACAACATPYQGVTTEIAWYERDGGHRGWLHATRDLCRPCRVAQKAFWFARARPVARQVQLHLLSDADAPLKGVDLAEARLSRADLEDLATVRRWGGRQKPA